MSRFAGGHYALVDMVIAEEFHLAHPTLGDLQPWHGWQALLGLKAGTLLR